MICSLKHSPPNYCFQIAVLLFLVPARADADRQVHQAQALWSATSALWSTMRNVDASQPWQNQLRPLRTEVEAVKKAAGECFLSCILSPINVKLKEC